MDDEKRNLLNTNREVICRSIDVYDTLLKLRKFGIFDQSDEEIVRNQQNHPTNLLKIGQIIDIILYRGDNGFWAFAHAIRNKAKNVFERLHNHPDLNVEECTFCDIDPAHACVLCSLLVTILNDPARHVFIDKPSQLSIVVEDMKMKIINMEEQKKEDENYNKKHNKLLHEQIDRLMNEINEKKKQSEEKDKYIYQLNTEKVKSLKDNEETSAEFKEMKKKNEILAKEVNDLKKEVESFKKMNKDNKDQHYENIDVSNKERLRLMTQDVEILAKQNAILEAQRESYEQQKETAEDIIRQLKMDLRNVKSETTPYFNDVDTLNHFHKIIDQKEKEINGLKEAFNNILKTKPEAPSETERLNEQLEVIKSECRRYQEIEENFRAKVQELTQEKDLLEQQHRSDSEKMASLESLQVENKKLGKYVNFFGRKDLDREVKMVMNGKLFGVWFGHKSDALIGESSIFISEITKLQIKEPKPDVRTSDFVLTINDVNVTEFDLKDIKSLLDDFKKENITEIRILTRRPESKVLSSHPLKVSRHGNHTIKTIDDFGLELNITTKVDSKKPAYKLGFRNGDVFFQVGKHKADSLSVSEIYSKCLKMVAQSPNEIVVRRYLMQRHSVSSYSSIPEELRERRERATSSPAQPRYESCPSFSTPNFGTPNFGAPVENSDSIRSLPHHDIIPPLRQQVSREPPIPTPPMRKEQILQNPAFTHSISSSSLADEKYDRLDRMSRRSNGSDKYVNNKITKVLVNKNGFGIHIIGGNKVGIYVSSVVPELQTEIQHGWKIHKINGFIMENVALCYAKEMLKKYNNGDKIEFEFKNITWDDYQEQMKKKPYDYFYIRTLFDYRAANMQELSFNVNDNLTVIDSYNGSDSNQTEDYKWLAFKEGRNGAQFQGLIPSLRSLSKSNEHVTREHVYHDIGASNFTENCYYKILDRIGEVLVCEQ